MGVNGHRAVRRRNTASNHPLVTRLKYESADSAQFGDWAHILFDQALLAEGGSLSDPATFVKRLNEMLLANTK